MHFLILCGSHRKNISICSYKSPSRLITEGYPFLYISPYFGKELLQDSTTLESLHHEAMKFLIPEDVDYNSIKVNCLKPLPGSLWLEAIDVLLLEMFMTDPSNILHLENYTPYVSLTT